MRNEYDSLSIGGQWQPAGGDERVPAVSPPSGEPILWSPFGGYTLFGIGREHGFVDLEGCLEYKSIDGA